MGSVACQSLSHAAVHLWTTSMVIDTVNGQPAGQVVMSPSFLFNNANFGVWLRDWLMKTGS